MRDQRSLKSPVGRAQGILIHRSRIDHCGDLPAINHAHGIYVQEATRMVVRRNHIYLNSDRAIQRYLNADDSLIAGNVIDGDGEGLNSSCDRSTCSQKDLVEGNLISYSARWNVHAHSQGARPYGTRIIS